MQVGKEDDSNRRVTVFLLISSQEFDQKRDDRSLEEEYRRPKLVEHDIIS